MRMTFREFDSQFRETEYERNERLRRKRLERERAIEDLKQDAQQTKESKPL